LFEDGSGNSGVSAIGIGNAELTTPCLKLHGGATPWTPNHKFKNTNPKQIQKLETPNPVFGIWLVLNLF
jgi:hypothetical protein